MDTDTQTPEQETEEAPQIKTLDEQVDAIVEETLAKKEIDRSTDKSLVKETVPKRPHRYITVGDSKKDFVWVVPEGHNKDATCANCFFCSRTGTDYHCHLGPTQTKTTPTYSCPGHPEFKVKNKGGRPKNPDK